jgi:hypothetical protein
MAKRRVPGEKFRWEFLVLFIGPALALFLLSLLLVFAPALVWSLPAWEIAFLLGIIVTPWSFGIWGLALGFRYYTDKVIWDNRVVECSNPKMIELGLVSYPVDPAADRNDPTLTPAMREELEKSGALARTKIEKGQTVALRALALGGFWWGGFAIHPGADGYVLFYGEEWVNLHGNILIPRNLVLIHHSEVDQEILRKLEEATVRNGSGRFVQYRTPLYVCGDLNPGILEYMCSSTEIREGVYERSGLAGVARWFGSQMLRTMGPKKAQEIGLSMNGWQALINPIRDALIDLGLYNEAGQKGIQTVGGLRTEVRRLQQRITELETERQTNAATIRMYAGMINADASKITQYRGGFRDEQQVPVGLGPDRTRPGSDRFTGNQQ